jgi:hypothetical protein
MARLRRRMARERRTLRRGAFEMGAAMRSSATVAGIERDAQRVARSVKVALRQAMEGSRAARALRAAEGRMRAAAAGSNTLSGIGIDAQRVRRRLMRRRSSRGQGAH